MTTTVTETETERLLWLAVGANPADQLPRLVLADKLDENAGTVACGRCGGFGEWTSYRGPGTTGGICFVTCPACKGTGWVSDGRAEMAEALRATCEKVPGLRHELQRYRNQVWFWVCPGKGFNLQRIERKVYDRLSAADSKNWISHRYYPTALAAIRDLCRAWVRVNKGGAA